MTPTGIAIRSVGWPEIEPGADLAGLVAALPGLADGDVVVITSKVVSKAEGRLSERERSSVVEEEARRVVARRGTTVVAETAHGLVLAAAGVDASNVTAGKVLTLPVDPDATARAIRDEVLERTAVNVAIVISDTAGRAWRNGQTDLAIGCAGIAPFLDLQGRPDTHGRALVVTQPAVADEIAAAGDLVKGKLSGRPVAVVSGLAGWVLAPGCHGPGAVALVRDADVDLFGLGTREAVEVAVGRRDAAGLARFPRRVENDRDPFGALRPAPADVRIDVHAPEPAAARPRWVVEISVRDGSGEAALLAAGRAGEQAATLAAAHRLRPVRSVPGHGEITGWRAVIRLGWIVA